MYYKKRKSLFLANAVVSNWTTEKLLLGLFLKSKYFVFKKYFLLLWFKTYFLAQDFILLVYPLFFIFFKLFNFKTNFYLFLNLKLWRSFIFFANLSLTFFGNFYSYSFFSIKWLLAINNFFLIPASLRFNLWFLLKNNEFLKNFIILFRCFFINFNQNCFLLSIFSFILLPTNVKFLKELYLYRIVKVFFMKLKFLIESGDFFLLNLQFLKNLKFKFCYNFFFFNNSSKDYKKIFNNYSSYQAFLNTSLYLTWSFLFSKSLTSSSLNILLLKNFNKIFYRVGDKKKSFFILEHLFWAKQSVLFWKGYPYFTFYPSTQRENFLLMSIFSTLETEDAKQFLYINFFYLNEFASRAENLKFKLVYFNNFFLG